MTRRSIVSAVSLAATIALGLPATATTQQAPPAPATCDAAEHRQFDFWLGEWDVTTPDGKPAGRNSVTRELNGCVIHEHWFGAGGMNGESFNTWDRVTRRWHQTWVSTRGDLALLDGAFQDGSMQMSGPAANRGPAAMNRITWTPASDGSVRQLWEVSGDRGQTWTVAFDGRYRRAKS